MARFRMLLFSLLLANSAAGIFSYQFNVSSLIDNIANNHDKRIRPYFGGGPVNVGVSMYILNIDAISELNMDFSVDMYFRQTWRDPRLAFYEPRLQSRLIVPPGSFWEPDTFFPTAKNVWFHSATQPNTFHTVSPNGTVLVSTKVSLTASCNMDLRYFPMDIQICSLEIESYGFRKDEISYHWKNKDNPVGLAHWIRLPHHKIMGQRAVTKDIILSSGNYSRLQWDVILKRSVSPYVVQIFFPAILIVMFSWLPFWFDPSDTAARSCIAIVTALAMVQLTVHADAELPPSACIKSIEIYLAVCFGLIALSLVELTMVIMLKKRSEDDSEVKNAKCSGKGGCCKLFIGIEKLDKYSRIAFPIFFAIFNILYWVIVRTMSKAKMSEITA